MGGYAIRVGTRVFATDAENVMEAENKFIDQFPEFENERVIVSEVDDILLLNESVVVF